MLVKLSDIATYKQGKQVDISQQFLDPFHKSIRFIRIIDYTNPNEPIRYVQDFGKQYHVNSKDLVMIRYGSQTAGRVVRGIEGLIANNMFKICFNKQVNLDYLYYYLSRDIIFSQLRSNQSSSTMPAITFEMMNSLLINFPNEEQQCHIVDTIGSIDDLIENLSAQNANINSLIGLYCNKTIVTCEQITTFDYYISEETARQGNNDYLLLSVVNSGEVIEQNAFFNKDTSSKDRKKYKIVKPLFFAFNPARANIGSIGMWNSTEYGCISPIYCVFKVAKDYELFFNFYLKTDYVKKEIVKRSSGSVRQNLPYSEFAKIEIPLISIDKIQNLNAKIVPLWKLIESNNIKIRELERIKNSYLNKFFG